jgi:hypothetical protein
MGTKSRITVPSTEEFLDALVAPTFEGVFATMLQLYARQKGKPRVGEKTPGHHAYLGEILENFPESPVIFVMRDPRDTIFSMREALGTTLRGAINQWNDAFESYERHSSSVHLIRYEYLVANPAEQCAALCAHLGEPYEPEMLRFHEGLRQRSHPVPHQHRRLLEPVSATSVGRFSQMPRRDIELIESGCAAGMEALGYEFTLGRPKAAQIKPEGRMSFLVDRLRFYGLRPVRWRRALTRWKIVLRVRASHLLSSTRKRIS